MYHLRTCSRGDNAAPAHLLFQATLGHQILHLCIAFPVLGQALVVAASNHQHTVCNPWLLDIAGLQLLERSHSQAQILRIAAVLS